MKSKSSQDQAVTENRLEKESKQLDRSVSVGRRAEKNKLSLPLLVVSSFFVAVEAFSAPVDLSESFTYQGRFLSSDGSTALTEVLSLQLSIYDPTATCLLYQESQSVDTSQTNGLFAIDVGSVPGDTKRSALFNNSVSLDPGLTMAKIFANSGQILAAGSPNCATGYTPAAGDGRLLRVTILPATGSLTTLSPDLGINSVPLAKVAEVAQTLQGYVPGTSAGNLVQLDTTTGKLPAVDGSQLTNLNASNINSGNLSSSVLPSNITATITGTASGNVVSVTGTAPVVSSGGLNPAISMAAATSTSNGYLTSANWNTFNNKVSSVSSSGAPIVIGGTATAPTVGMSSANSTTSGYLASADWNTFNNKGNGTVTSVTGSGPISVSNGTSTPGISMAQATSSTSGYLSSSDWTTFNGKATASTYSSACNTQNAGSGTMFCCQMNKSSGSTACKWTNVAYPSSWTSLTNNPSFSPSFGGPYSLSIASGESGYQYLSVCLSSDSTGNTMCQSYNSVTSNGTWSNLVSPF